MKLITALLLLSLTAQAEPTTIAWTIANTLEDGTPVDISEVEGVNLYFKAEGGEETDK